MPKQVEFQQLLKIKNEEIAELESEISKIRNENVILLEKCLTYIANQKEIYNLIIKMTEYRSNGCNCRLSIEELNLLVRRVREIVGDLKKCRVH